MLISFFFSLFWNVEFFDFANCKTVVICFPPQNNQAVGVGSGSTIVYAVDRLGERLHHASGVA